MSHKGSISWILFKQCIISQCRKGEYKRSTRCISMADWRCNVVSCMVEDIDALCVLRGAKPVSLPLPSWMVTSSTIYCSCQNIIILA